MAVLLFATRKCGCRRQGARYRSHRWPLLLHPECWTLPAPPVGRLAESRRVAAADARGPAQDLRPHQQGSEHRGGGGAPPRRTGTDGAGDHSSAEMAATERQGPRGVLVAKLSLAELSWAAGFLLGSLLLPGFASRGGGELRTRPGSRTWGWWGCLQRRRRPLGRVPAVAKEPLSGGALGFVECLLAEASVFRRRVLAM